MFWNMLSIENTKLFRRSILWIELIAITLIVIVMNVFLYTLVHSDLLGGEMPPEARAPLQESLVWPGSLLNSLEIGGANAVGGLLTIVLVGAVTAQEYTWRTYHLWLSQGMRRQFLVSAKFVSLALPLLLIVLAPLAAGGAITAWFSYQIDGSLNLERLNSLQLAWSVLRAAYTLLPYAALAFLLGIATRSTAAAIGAGLAYSLLIENVLVQLMSLAGGTLGQIGRYLPLSLGTGLLRLNKAAVTIGTAPPSNAGLLSPTSATVGIAVWTLIFFGLALVIFFRQDLTE